MSDEIIAFLPCRSGSERAPLKNTRPFTADGQSLTSLKLDQLLKVPELDKIILSTDDEIVKEIGMKKANGKITIDDRPTHLASSQTSTDELILYVSDLINSGHVLWTHVTSPFVDHHLYSKAILEYFSLIQEGEKDSLMSVTRLHKFLWNASKPLNYSRDKEKWPRTQTIEPVFEVNSAIFISPALCYSSNKDRIGNTVHFFEIDEKKAFDIDWEFDFHLAQLLYNDGER